MKHSTIFNIIRILTLIPVFAIICGLSSGLHFAVRAAESTVLINGSPSEIRLDGVVSESAGKYTFTDKLTINIISPIKEQFNRYNIIYSSDAHIQGTVYYIENGMLYEEDFFLEPGEKQSFSSLTDGYIRNTTGTEISRIELKTINTSKAVFSIEQINTAIYDVLTDDTVYLENNRFKLGVHLLWGGGLSYLEDKNDGDPTVTNMLNCHDTGRLVQQSYYGISGEPYENAYFGGNLWSYNPVQGGDQYGNKSKLVDYVVYEDSIYVKCRPLDWAQNNKYTFSYMENQYTITDDYISVDNRFIDFSTYNHGSAKDQELPAFYTISYLDTFTFYNGNKPWTNGALTVKKDLPFWGGNIDSYFTMESGNTETWCAWTSSERGYGLGLFTPNITTLLAGRNAYNGSKSAAADATNYVAPLIRASMKNCEAFEYRYLITSGTVDSIRSVFTNNRDVANRPWHVDSNNLQYDIDGDGNVDGIDAGLAMQIVADWDMDGKVQESKADINRDGTINGYDVELLIQHIADWKNDTPQ